jgi:parallel beta-helix repeat protein
MVKKIYYPIIMAMAILAGLLLILRQSAYADTIVQAPANTWCVKPGGGGGCYASIQLAINAAANNDVINVAAGTYLEHITVNKNVKIYGAGWPNTIIDGAYASAQPVVYFPPGISSTAVLSGVQVTRGGSGTPATSSNNGGGIKIDTSSPTIINTWANNNTATNGGGVYVSGGTPKLQNVPAWNNQVIGSGGGYALQGNAVVTITADYLGTNGTIWWNSAGIEGGGVYIYQATASISGLRIFWNNSYTGGGIDLETLNDTVRLFDNTIASNYASNSGGGMYINQVYNFEITGNIIYTNTASTGNGGGGAAIYESGGSFSSNIVQDNATPGFGGGVLVGALSNLTFRYNWFLSNEAAIGGGMSVISSTPLIDANVFFSNTATNYGGAIELFQNTTFSLTNNMLARNTSPDAAGISIDESTVNFINNTVADNLGSGIWVRNSSGGTIVNNLVTGNSGNGVENYNDSSTGYTLDYNDVYNNPYVSFSAGAHDLSLDPLYQASGVDLLQYYHLQTSSPVSKTGSLSWAPGLDIDAQQRKIGSSVSMGADEIRYVNLLPLVFKNYP